jgi:predicted CoA-binding protein
MEMTDDPIQFVDEPLDERPAPVLDVDAAREVLRVAHRIAVVGASPNRWRASNSVMSYLLKHGFECVPVNPNEPTILGRPCFPTLEAAVAGTGGMPFDIVDVFRRPGYAPDIARSAVALGCGTLWLQQRVVSWEAARIAHDGGLKVVMDRCSAVEHRRLRALQS